MRIMVNMGASVDKGVEKEDLGGQTGDSQETSNKTLGRELSTFSRNNLFTGPWALEGLETRLE